MAGVRGQHTPRPIPGDPADRYGFPRLVEQFCEHLAVSGYSPGTIRSRRQHLAMLAEWLHERGVSRPVEVTRPMLVRWQRSLFHHRKPDGRPLSFRVQAQRVISARSFFTWTVRANLVLANPASELVVPKVEHRLPAASLSVAEAELVLAQPDLSTLVGLRDRAMLEVLYSTGIRRAELAGLHLADIDPARSTLFVRQGKGRKDRLIPIGTRAITWVQKYLTDARPRLVAGADPDVLFLSLDGAPLEINRLTSMARGYVHKSGVGKPGACHLFRHTMATLMLNGGADIRHIQAILGHADLSTTQIYTHVAIAALQAVHTHTHPAATNTPHRREQTELSHDERHDDDRQLLLFSVLDLESDEENRPPTGSPDESPGPVLRRSRRGHNGTHPGSSRPPEATAYLAANTVEDGDDPGAA